MIDISYDEEDRCSQISVFVDNYNNKRVHESLNNLTPADVYYRRGQDILEERENIKKLTIQNRRLQH
jgi:putative transposase